MIGENILISFLERFDENPFLVKLEGKEYLIGEGEPTFSVKFNRTIPMKDLLTSTSLALGEAYMQGIIEVEGDLYEALNKLLGQMSKFSTDQKALKKIMFSSTSKKNQVHEVQSHYDLGNDFYHLWLDETMSYSCGYFLREDNTLKEAQENKVDYILEKLHLQEGMELLDIGCGWGFLLIEAAQKYKIKGTGITLSKEQYREFKTRIKNLNLQDFLEVKLMDYRDLPGQNKKYHRIVSVGMLEHVGRNNYREFVEVVNNSLEKGGLFLLHFISALQEHPGDPWIKKYIFPGGTIPSLREMINHLGDFDFHTLDVENLRPHYNRTLLYWRKNYWKNIDQIRQKFDESFVRMWDLYLASCAATFNNGIIDLHQLLLSKGVNNDLPLVRWY